MHTKHLSTPFIILNVRKIVEYILKIRIVKHYENSMQMFVLLIRNILRACFSDLNSHFAQKRWCLIAREMGWLISSAPDNRGSMVTGSNPASLTVENCEDWQSHCECCKISDREGEKRGKRRE